MQASTTFVYVLFLAAVSTCQGIKVSSHDSALTKERPVTKIVNMLKDMQETLEKEKEEDEDLYASLTCWCKEARKSVGDNVQAAQDRIAQLQSKVDELNATVLSCENAMDSLKQQVQAAEAASDEARVLRGKQYETFKEDDQTYNEDIYAVESAATVLGDTGSLLQIPGGQKPEDLTAALSRVMSRRAEQLDNSLGYAERDMIKAFIEDPHKFVQNKAAFLQEGRGEPATTFKLMAEDFEKDQQQLQEAEKIAKTNFEELIAAKKVEITAGEKQREKKRGEKAVAKEDMFKANVEVKDKQKAIKAEAEFAKVMEEKCSTSDEEWALRTKGRAEEIEAVGKAIQILDADEAHATFGRTYSFLQMSSENSRRTKVAAELSAAGNKQKDSRLVALALKAKLDSFTKVKAAIDEMTAALKKEEQDEVDQKQFCTDAFNKNTAKVVAEKDAKAGFENQMVQLKEKLNAIAEEVERLKAEVAKTQEEMKVATENRKKEKADFEVTLADQQATQGLLAKALNTLRAVYQEGPSMLQASGSTSVPDVPEGFKEYKKNKNSFSVMSLMQQIIAETKAMEAEITRDEKNAEDTHNREMAAAQGNIDALNQGLANQASDKATTTKALLQATKSLEGSEAELADLAQEEADLHASCDFLLKNWDLRVTARREEIEALAKAKHILAGGNFLQK
eukprot:TRINITY_DN5535_c0_g1_i1.p1 TRINITY_DN5535_c0_g1~~TRINITY_DN5535_c0_g1_i1.p1  ORF type:complete len:680 (+),score=266.67 TRINITY_DN5535_c0_g1_i1:69-2108(+)